MLELLGLLAFAAVAIVVVLVVGLLAAPFLLLLALAGFVLRAVAHLAGWILGGLVLVPLGLVVAPVLALVVLPVLGLVVLPVLAIAAGVVLFKLTLLALPFLVLGLLLWALVRLVRRPAAA